MQTLVMGNHQGRARPLYVYNVEDLVNVDVILRLLFVSSRVYP